MYVDTQAYIDDRTETKVLIRKAHDLLKDKGWVQGAYVKGTRHCIIGALMEASNMPITDILGAVASDYEHIANAVELLGAAIGMPVHWQLFSNNPDDRSLTRQIERWNDDEGRTKRQVLAAMKKACT